MDHLYGDGTSWNLQQYKELLEESNDIYNLHNTLLQLTNHIFDGDAQILQSWKNINKMTLQDFDNSESWIKNEVKSVEILENSIQEYKELLKQYLFKIDKLLSENPEIIKAQEKAKENTANNNILNKLKEEQEREEKLKKSKELKKKEKKDKILKIALQVVTVLICLLIIFLINRRTKFINGMLVFRKK